MMRSLLRGPRKSHMHEIDGGEVCPRREVAGFFYLRRETAARCEMLTAKQEAFAREYLLDLNATQAAIRAGYSAKTAKQQGQRLLTNVDVQAAVTAGQDARATRTEIDADWVLKRLADEAIADLGDLIDANGAVKPVADWPLIWRQGLVSGFEVSDELVDGVKVGNTTKIKLSDRIKRIELIGKHVNVQAFRDQVHSTGSIALTVSPEDAEL